MPPCRSELERIKEAVALLQSRQRKVRKRLLSSGMCKTEVQAVNTTAAITLKDCSAGWRWAAPSYQTSATRSYKSLLRAANYLDSNRSWAFKVILN